MQDFASKQNALFASLDNASKELKGTILDQSADECFSEKRLKPYRCGKLKSVSNSAINENLKHLRGKESIFKKPEMPLARCLRPRIVPDYQVNPQNWKKYSLADVDISDKTNTAAALAFLNQLNEKNITSNDCAEEQQEKIKFHKSSKILQLKTIQDSEIGDAFIDQPKHKGSKLVMPEYVIGKPQKPKRQIKKSTNKTTTNFLKLSHLEEEDADD